MADMDASKASARKGVRVRLPLPALGVALRNVSAAVDNIYMYPRSTVDLALRLPDLGILDRENALICGVTIPAIRHWRRGSRRSKPDNPLRKCPRCEGRSLNERAYAYLLGLCAKSNWNHGSRKSHPNTPASS